MKKSILLVLSAVILIFAVQSWGQEEQKSVTDSAKVSEKTDSSKPKELRGPSIGTSRSTSRVPSSPASRTSRLGAQMEMEYKKKTSETEKLLIELKNILKLAEEEKASKTTEAVKSMIEMRQKELEIVKKQHEARIKKMEELMKRQGSSPRSRAIAPPSGRNLPSRRPAPLRGAQGLEKK